MKCTTVFSDSSEKTDCQVNTCSAVNISEKTSCNKLYECHISCQTLFKTCDSDKIHIDIFMPSIKPL